MGDRILVYNQWARKGVPVLEAVLTGEAGEACWGREDGEVVDAVVRLVRMNMGRERIGEVVEATVTRWEEDELFMGAYSYYGLGSTTRDLEAMRERVGCEGSYLLFAGEHCDEEVSEERRTEGWNEATASAMPNIDLPRFARNPSHHRSTRGACTGPFIVEGRPGRRLGSVSTGWRGRGGGTILYILIQARMKKNCEL